LEDKFDQWAILELMGHRRLAGKVTEATIGGGAFIRIDIPMKGGTTSTQFYSPGSIYCITPTSEAIAREVAKSSQPEPVNRWELKGLMEPEIKVPSGTFDFNTGDNPRGSDFDRDEDNED